jgi:hypothetical protein
MTLAVLFVGKPRPDRWAPLDKTHLFRLEFPFALLAVFSESLK